MGTTRLLEFFQQKGKITKEQADDIRVRQANEEKNEESLLLEGGLVKDDDIAKAKGEIFNYPYVDILNESIDESVFNLISADKLKRYRAVPFAKAGHIIKVAMVDPFDVQAIQALQQLLKGHGRVLAHISTVKAINHILDRKAGSFISAEVTDALSKVGDEVKSVDITDAESLDDASIRNAPVARIVNSIMRYAVKSEASDIHIEPQERQVRVRFRINGVMTEKLILPKTLHSALVARIKIVSDMKIDEKRIPQDDRFQVVVDNKRVDVRVSTLPSIFGEKIVMRLLDNSGGVPTLETTGLRGKAYKNFIDAIKATSGIILITGPTGSGKTQTLAGALGRLNDPTVNIITLENPVEIKIPGVTQVQINPDVGFTFASALRSVLRQDPDIIMIGEIRDEETAQLAVEASLTGHLVLATLHTNGAAAAIPRLLDMNVASYLLASSLKLAAAQRLPRRLCNYCKKAVVATPEKIAHIQGVLGSINGFDLANYMTQYSQSEEGKKQKAVMPTVDQNGNKVISFYEPVGCEKCNNLGYKGRIGIFEAMIVSDAIKKLISDDVPEGDINKVAVSEGMITLIQDGYLKAVEGITTIEEVLRVSRV